MKRLIGLLLSGILFSNTATADDFASKRLENWSQWRGPNADGISPNANPPSTWDESTNVKWKAKIPGSGSSTPIIWEDKIFVAAAIQTDRKGPAAVERTDDQRPQRPGSWLSRRFGARSPENIFQFLVFCLDRESGRVLWKRVVVEEQPHEGCHRSHGFASGSPTTDGRSLYVSFGSRGIYALDFDGNLRWKRDLGDMRTRNAFGEGASPVLCGDSLVVNWDHEGNSFIVCLDAATGEKRWRTPRDEATTWCTPFVVQHNGMTQVVINGTNRVRSYDLATGKLIWECGGQVDNPVASPVASDGIVYLMTGRRGYALQAISLDSSGDLTDSNQIAWQRDRGTPYVPSPVLHDGLLYFLKSCNGILTCVRADSGEELYAEQRLADVPDVYASLGFAAGKVFVVGRNGTTVVVKHGPTLEVLAVNRLQEGIDASPVFVGNELFLRGTEHLYCIVAD
ncbi:MAG: PQQ-like beta-propeller repeat protein [Candidatus Nealsonbacteria bacterium]|nr:PQQ-like beta-propeller repeat protein [Candidatus Nealsonbacteria bacterium]